MPYCLHVAVVALASILCATVADPLTFCKDKDCGNCPVSVASVGPGFPECAIYRSRDVFDKQNFPSENGLISAYVDVPQQDTLAPCYLIFKSPASTTRPGCGEIQKYFHDATCGTVNLEETFIVQFCCGIGDCAAAGIPGQPGKAERSPLLRSAKFGRGTDPEGIAFLSAAGGSGGGVQSLRIAVNGTEIKPVYVGPPQLATENASSTVSRRHGGCDGDWVPYAGYEDYTRPADGSKIVSSSVSGPLAVSVIHARTQEWTQTFEQSLGFDDILSLGISFTESFSKSITNSQTIQYPVPENETGYIAWTSFLRCSRGFGSCGDRAVSGEVCTPYRDANSGELAGEFSVVQSGDNGGMKIAAEEAH
ncbi:hypothetical protein O1611_g867 [Lasiodiplodia mahajangana]|uniref:Uncharacterized protein n=1 Tax=Lasiodiplodia mahajangana TaxID=1108764 RepID=A0ACC2JZY0_9PEZI|nr:hypothetical protein O1611_g867 [Lasiodiplodia mahajangana]